VSLFGEQLQTFIKSHEINIRSLTQKAGIERTAVHRIMTGERVPSEEYVSKLLDALPLSPAERQQFEESYHISQIGELKYRQRQQVKELIEAVAHIENGAGVLPPPCQKMAI
jgi:transcriptional regulator with XRE-family HTH domain